MSSPLTSMLPSLGLVVVAVFAMAARAGFRGRPTTAGIDLGTTNSVVCVQTPDEGVGKIECVPDPFTGSPVVPSVVSYLDRPEAAPWNPHSYVLVGERARRRVVDHPSSTFYHAKRVLGRARDDPAVATLAAEVGFAVENDPDDEQRVLFPLRSSHRHHPSSLSPADVGSKVVEWLLAMAAHHSRAYSSLTSAVIAVPAAFDATQRRETVDAFRAAGVKVARVLDEPVAAALAYGLEKKPGVEHALVYDFGGGTLDVSLLRLDSRSGYVEVVGTDGDDDLGGVDFDLALGDFLSRRETGRPEAEVRAAAEPLKIALSEAISRTDDSTTTTTPIDPTTTVSVTLPACGAELSVAAAEYDEAVASLYPRSIEPVRRLLKDLDMSHDEVDEVVMVGGTTRMPQIRALVAKEFADGGAEGRLNTEIDPDLTVAYGAASVVD